MTQEVKEEFLKKIEADSTFVAKNNLNAVINKLIYDYIHDNNHEKISQSPDLYGLSASEKNILENIVSNPQKKKKLFDYISDSVTLSNRS